MQVFNLGQRVFKVSKGDLKPQDVMELPKDEAEHLFKMFKDEIKLIEVKKEETEEKPKKAKSKK